MADGKWNISVSAPNGATSNSVVEGSVTHEQLVDLIASAAAILRDNDPEPFSGPEGQPASIQPVRQA